MVSIDLYCVCSIQTNTHPILANTYKYIPIQHTNGDETHRVGQYGLAIIWYVFGMYLVYICLYLHVLPPANPSGFVPVCIQDWHVFGMYLACICICIGLYTTNLIQTNTNHYKYLGSIERNTGVILRQYIVNGLVCIGQ